MKILFSIFWLLQFNLLTNPTVSPGPAAPATTIAGSAGLENAPPVRSTGTLVEYYEGNGIGKIKPWSSNQTITVLVSDIKGRKKIELNTEVTYIEVNNPKSGRHATEVDVVKP